MPQHTLQSRFELRSLVAAIGVKLEKKGMEAEQRRHDENAAVAILDIRRVNDGVHQQALRVDENVPFFALDLLARIVTGWVDRAPPFSALFTL